MQVQSNPQIPNSVPNFKAIKSIKVAGLYKEHPELGKKLVDAFQTNDIAMNFCKKYDVDIVFHACKEMMDSVKSSVAIFFNNPAKKKIFGLVSGAKDSIVIYGYGNKYNLQNSLEASAENLELSILKEGARKGTTGVLNGQIKYKQNEIEQKLNSISDKAEDKNYRKYRAGIMEAQQQEKQKKLGESIEKLMSESK